MADYKVVTSDFLNLQISTSASDLLFGERRFAKDLTIKDLKAKLELMTGGSCQTMQLEVYSDDNKLLCALEDDQALLGSYPIDVGMRLHVIDKFAIKNELESGSVEKFTLSEEEYAKKEDSVRAFLMKNKLGHFNEEMIKKKQKQEKDEEELCKDITVGSRCKITLQAASPRLGTVMYTGKLEGLSGYWIGVKYDEPLGKNDGTFKEKRYFECPDKYGAFVKPQCVICGDFPEEEYDLNEEI